MKKTNQFLIAIASMLLFFSTSATFAQDDAKIPQYVVATTLHWNMDYENFDMDTWKAVEKEYLDKVTMKNEHVLAAGVYMHRYTPDNTELVVVQAYESWDAIDKAGDRNAELAKLAWPDSIARRDYFKKRNAYYADVHSDEIYATMPGAKALAGPTDKDLVTYVRTRHFAFPEDGSQKEFSELHKEAVEKIINKNEYVKAYYPNAHAWGSDRTVFLEVFYVDSLGDVDKMLDKNGELAKEAWPDDAARKERGKKVGKYFTGVHGDAIYTYIAGLSK